MAMAVGMRSGRGRATRSLSRLATAPYPQVPANVPVTVTMGGLPCPINYAGGASYLVSGVMQINAQAPTGVTPGPNVTRTITIGGVSAQTGVTLAVK